MPVDVTPTWFLVAGLITWGFAPTVERHGPRASASWRYAVSLAFALLLYLSVLVHELSHTVVALQAGLPVRRISLHLLGGVSEIERPAKTAGREAGIAAAGPASRWCSPRSPSGSASCSTRARSAACSPGP